MAQKIINIGASPSDGTGSPLRVSFDQINQNFTELYSIVAPTTGNSTTVTGNVSSVAGKIGAVRLTVDDIEGAASQNYIDSKLSELVFDAVNDQIVYLTGANSEIVADMNALSAVIQENDGYMSIVDQLSTKLSTTNGGTMLAPLYLSAEPTTLAEAANKQYVDSKIQLLTSMIEALASTVYTKTEIDQLLLNITSNINGGTGN